MKRGDRGPVYGGVHTWEGGASLPHMVSPNRDPVNLVCNGLTAYPETGREPKVKQHRLQGPVSTGRNLVQQSAKVCIRADFPTLERNTPDSKPISKVVPICFSGHRKGTDTSNF